LGKKIYRRKTASHKTKSAEKRRFPWKRALLLFLSFLVFFSLYQIGIYFYQLWILHAYCIAAGVLVVAYAAWNRGVFRVPKAEELPKEWKKDEKEAFIAEIAGRRAKSSILLYFLIPLIMTVLFDTVWLFLTLNLGLDL